MENKKELIFENMKIVRFVRELKSGEFLIPAFQRDFIWDMKNIISLWNSIFNFYPIGAILYWDTDIRLNIQRRLGGHLISSEESKSGNNRLYILDGQQRSTALLITIFGGKGKTEDFQEIDYALYFNAVDGSFFPADEYNRRSLDVNPAFLIRLQDVVDWPEDLAERLSHERGYDSLIGKNIAMLMRVFKDYRVPLTRLKGFEIKDVCEVFERINEEGRRLKSMDLLISRHFHNYKCLVEEDFEEKGVQLNRHQTAAENRG